MKEYVVSFEAPHIRPISVVVKASNEKIALKRGKASINTNKSGVYFVRLLNKV